VIARLNKALEKGHTLFRNQKLGTSEIIVPLILVGSSGIYVMEATPLKGFYRTRGEEWGTITNGRFQQADINLITRTERMAKALQKFFEQQGVKLSAPIEPVLLAVDPGMHIDSMRPAVRVVMSDAIDRFAASLLTGRVLYDAATVNELSDHILDPAAARKQKKPAETAEPAPKDERPVPTSEPSRMRTILNAPHNDALIESGRSDLDFAFADEKSAQPTVMVSNPAPPFAEEYPEPAKPAQRRILGMTIPQLIVVAGMALVECCVLAAFAGIVWYFNR